MPVQIEKREIITVKDDNGNVLSNGDPIMIRVQKQDIVCRFIGILNGYFVTQTLADGVENKYRQGSIEKVERISGINSYPEQPAPVTEGQRLYTKSQED